jgi:predicted GIY-YIG superfamily endonuclease
LHYVYLIQHSIDKSFYVGSTGDITRRISEHNRGDNASTKRSTGEWVLIYSEAYRTKEDAVLREHRLKKNHNSRKELMKRVVNSVISSERKKEQ